MADELVENANKIRKNAQDLYDREYFEKHCGPVPYTRSLPRWQKFFGDIAEELVRSLKPRTVLDVGCAIGFLIEAFWRRGVRAYGIDISEYAIGEVPQDLRPFCRLASITEPLPDDFPQRYDLITCIEVLEHISEEDGKRAIKNMASRSPCIVFSSNPHDLTEPTHINVRPVLYWLQLFAEVGFYPDLRFDASFISPQAFLLKRDKAEVEDVLSAFALSIDRKFEMNAQQREIVKLTQRNEELERRAEIDLQEKETLLRRLQRVEHEAAQLQRNEASRAQEQDRFQKALADKERAFLELGQKLEAQVLERDRRIDLLELAQSGLFWEILVAYRRAKDRCLPAGTTRRSIYDWGLAGVKALKERTRLARVLLLPLRHPVKALRNLNTVNIGKFFYYFRNSDISLVESKLEKKLGIGGFVPQPVPSYFRKFCLIISGCPGDAFRYRCEHQAEQLRFFGFTVDVGYFDQIDFDSILKCYECFWLHRVPHTVNVESFIRNVEEIGKPVIFDTDDLVFDEDKIPYIRALQWMPPEEVRFYYDGVRRYHRTLSLCKFATVTTQPLRDAVQRLFPNIRCFVNPNGLSDAQLLQAEEALNIRRPLEDESIARIAYFSGTHTHNVDFEGCSKAAERILVTYPQARLMIVGQLDIGDQFNRFGDRVERVPLLPWQELPRMFRRVDINLAPLELDNPFTEAKSNLKYFEAAVLGVPTVASSVKPFEDSIKHGENGYLCRTDDEWVHCIAELVQNGPLRREIGCRARTEVLKKFTIRKGAPNLLTVVRNIFQIRALPPKNHLSIAFVLRAPIAEVGGGYKVIFLLANYLARRDHDVHLYIEPIAHLEGKNDREIIEFCHSYFGDSPAQIHAGHHSIQACDVAIATNWPTASVVDSLANALCKMYLIQDFEPNFYEDEDPVSTEVERTYELPLRKVTIGRYLASLFAKKDQLPTPYFDFAIDHEVFNTAGRETASRGRILFFARPSLKRRGYPIGIQALARIHEECPDIEVWFYGMEEKPRLPFPYTNLGVLDQQQLAQAMRESDIHLSFSLSNISQVPFQAMACGCAVVEAKVPSVEAMVENGKHCLLAEPDPDAVAKALVLLMRDERLRNIISKGGLELVAQKTWDKSCQQFEEIVLDSLLLKHDGDGYSFHICEP